MISPVADSSPSLTSTVIVNDPLLSGACQVTDAPSVDPGKVPPVADQEYVNPSSSASVALQTTVIVSFTLTESSDAVTVSTIGGMFSSGVTSESSSSPHPIKSNKIEIIEDLNLLNEKNNINSLTSLNNAFTDKHYKLIVKKNYTLKKPLIIYNITNEDLKKVKNLRDLNEIKKNYPKIFVIAPHPFHYKSVCLKNNVIKHLHLFDAWEYSFFYLKLINPNKKTLRLAKRYKKPVIGSSDVHFLKNLGKTYTLINAKKNEKDIFQAIKNRKVKIKTKPLKVKDISFYILNKIKFAIKSF